MINRLIERFKSEIGYREGEYNYNKYSNELYGKRQEWCLDFIKWCFTKEGLGSLIPDTSYVPSLAEYYDKKGMYRNSKYYKGNYKPQVGDLILFDFNNNKTSDHIGFIYKVSQGLVYTIEGNSNNQVQERMYNETSKYIRAYIELKYPIIVDIDKTVKEVNYKKIKKGDKVKVIKNVQYNGKTFKQWYKTYDVIEVSGNRVVIGKGNTVTCAINMDYLQKIN